MGGARASNWTQEITAGEGAPRAASDHGLQTAVQKRFGALLVGKMLGVVGSAAAVFGGLYLLGTTVGAEPIPLEDLIASRRVV